MLNQRPLASTSHFIIHNSAFLSLVQLKTVKSVADTFNITLIFSGLNKKLERMFANQDLIAPKSPKLKRCGVLEEVCISATGYMFLIFDTASCMKSNTGNLQYTRLTQTALSTSYKASPAHSSHQNMSLRSRTWTTRASTWKKGCWSALPSCARCGFILTPSKICAVMWVTGLYTYSHLLHMFCICDLDLFIFVTREMSKQKLVRRINTSLFETHVKNLMSLHSWLTYTVLS